MDMLTTNLTKSTHIQVNCSTSSKLNIKSPSVIIDDLLEEVNSTRYKVKCIPVQTQQCTLVKNTISWTYW